MERSCNFEKKHLEFEEKKFCGICNLKYDNHSNYNSNAYNQERAHIRFKNNIDINHLNSEFHKKSVERFNIYAN